jgi:hypothetical protein
MKEERYLIEININNKRRYIQSVPATKEEALKCLREEFELNVALMDKWWDKSTVEHFTISMKKQ